MNKLFKVVLLVLTLSFFVSACSDTDEEYEASEQNTNGNVTKQSISVAVTAADVYVNEQLISLDQPALIANERTLVPLQAICDRLDCSVKWNDSSKTATIRNKYVNIALQINNYTATKRYKYDPNNPEEIKLEIPPIIYNDRTYVPLRFVSESLNADVEWNANIKRVDITPKYNGMIYDFDDDGYAIIYKTSSSFELYYGMIDTRGNIVVEPIYDNIDTISGGLIAVSKNYKWGFVDTNGKTVIPTVYDDVYNFSEDGIAAAQKDGKYGIIDKNNNIVLPFEYDHIDYFKGNRAKISKNNKTGFVDGTGKIVIPTIYDSAEDFSEGFAGVQNDGKWFFINANGERNTQIAFDEVKSFSDGLAAIRENDKWGFINKNGEVVIQAKYDNVDGFSDGFAPASVNDKWGVINSEGTELTSFEYGWIGSFYNGYAEAGIQNKAGFISANGDFHNIDYDYICNFNENGLAAVCKNYKWGFINAKGEEVISCIYDQIDSDNAVPNRAWDAPGMHMALGEFYDGLTRVEKDGKWGFVDANGNEVIPLIYDYVGNFKDGAAKAEKDGLVYYIDKNGSRV